MLLPKQLLYKPCQHCCESYDSACCSSEVVSTSLQPWAWCKVQVEQLRQSRLEGETFKEQLAEARQQLSHQEHCLQQVRQQHQQLLEQVCQQRQQVVAEPAAQMQQHEGAALEQVTCAEPAPCCAVLSLTCQTALCLGATGLSQNHDLSFVFHGAICILCCL